MGLPRGGGWACSRLGFLRPGVRASQTPGFPAGFPEQSNRHVVRPQVVVSGVGLGGVSAGLVLSRPPWCQPPGARRSGPSLPAEIPLVQIILDSPDQCGLPQGAPGPSPGSPPSESSGSGRVWSSGWTIGMTCCPGLGACVPSVRGGPWRLGPEPRGCPGWVRSGEPGCRREAGSDGCGLHWLCLLGLRSSWGTIQQLPGPAF